MKPNDDPSSFASMFEAAPKQGAPRRFRVGDVMDLEVVRVAPTEVFVALDGKQEGFIEISELTDDSGKPTVSLGSRIAARVVQIDRGTGSVRLSPVSTAPIVAALADGPAAAAAGPAAARGHAVVAGMRVKGKVTGVERYGVFVEFQVAGEHRPGRGLVPVSELGTPRGADLRKLFPVGTDIEAAVVAIDERGRIRLSVTALNAAEERRDFETFASGGKDAAGKADKPTGAGFGTFGDLLKKRK
jgi:small subunit ribosomal protein S1